MRYLQRPAGHRPLKRRGFSLVRRRRASIGHGTDATDVLAALPDNLRARALTHSALARGTGDSYERLEFLGDSVLGLAASHLLFEEFADVPEGELSKVRAALVSRRVCALVAEEVGLVAAFTEEMADSHLEQHRSQQLLDSANVHADLVESVIGAAYLAHGFETAAELVRAWFSPHVAREYAGRRDAKSQLQEWAQARATMVEYETVGADGPDHNRIFTVEVRVIDEPHRAARGHGSSRKAAEQDAAQRLLAEVTAS